MSNARPGSIAELTSEANQADFAQWQNEIKDTWDRLELKPDDAVLLGSSALALYGLHASGDFGKADVDMYITTRTRNRLMHSGGAWWSRCQSDPDIRISPDRRPLILPRPFSGIVEKSLWGLDIPGCKTHAQMTEQQVSVEGITTLPLAKLVDSKVKSGRYKDYVAIVRAHLVAFAQESEVINNEEWLINVGMAIGSLERASKGVRARFRKTPGWIEELKQRDFKHPAFDKVYKLGMLAAAR